MSLKINNEKWAEANQHYLAGRLRLLHLQLEWYLGTIENGPGMKDRPDFSTIETELQETAAAMQVPPAIEQISSSFKLSDFERDILLLCAGMELDAGFNDLIAAIQGNATFCQPTFGLALASLQNQHWSAVAPSGALRFWRLIEVNKGQQVMRSPLKIDEHILHFLAGIVACHEIISELTTPVVVNEILVPSQQLLSDKIVVIYNQQVPGTTLPVIFLKGGGNFDKTAIAANAAKALGLRLFSLSAYNIPLNIRDITEIVRLWNREAILNRYMLYVDGTDLERGDKQRLQLLISFIENLQSPVILQADQWTPDFKRGKVFIDIEKPSSGEQKLLWQSVLHKAVLPAMELEKIVSQFNVSAGIIHKAGDEINTSIFLNGKNGSENSMAQNNLWKICCQYTRPQVDELAQRIVPTADWNDIVLPEVQLITLKEIALQIKNRNKVYGDWGFADKGARGLGISALFAGESGTGKTMAAEVLANELRLDLYKIDLSKVVNKYIGETEKNLKRIFDAAEEGGAILLFDEADALFGKRSDVKDSHDRYSNIEVSYLLQRMESYRGLAILTTNMKNAMDKAFLRRIRFVVHFPFPDASQRVEIWKKVFPVLTPKDGLDMEKLSRLTIPGGNIRNIAVNAAFLAADEDIPVHMVHIIRAARSEYDKIERPFVNI